MKIKPHSNHKLLRHEPLEDRHLLAVDLTGGLAGGMSSALFPQEELAAPQVATEIAANVEDFALIPGDIAESEANTLEQETNFAFEIETTLSFCGPVIWEESEQFQQFFVAWQDTRPDLPDVAYASASVPDLEMFVLKTSTGQSSIRPDKPHIGGPVMAFQTPRLQTANGTQKLERVAYVSTDVIDAPNALVTISGAGAEYWTCVYVGASEYDWLYRIPDDVANKDAPRDFTFTATRGGVSLSIPVHVAYAEVVVQFAGEGDFVERTAVGGQTAQNTVVVGQKVHAIVETSDKITVDPGSIEWSQPGGGNVVHDYITDETEGRIVDLWDKYGYSEGFECYFNEDLEFYYTSNTASKLGGLNATFSVTDVNGRAYGRSAYASYYVDAPTAVLTARKDGTTHVTSYFLNDYILSFDTKKPDTGPPYIGPQTTGGMIFNATITAPELNGDGKVAFLQTVNAYRETIEPGSVPDILSSHDDYVLDTHFPYNPAPNLLQNEWTISSGETICPQDDKPSPIQTEDSPRQPMISTVSEISVNDRFVMYLIYRPNGNNENGMKGSIWVPLREISWNWTATAEWKPDPDDNNVEKWMIDDTSGCDPNDRPVLSLPVWMENVENLKFTSETTEEE